MHDIDKLIAIARQLFELGEAELARTVLESCVARSPGHLEAHLELANVLWLSGARREALDVAQRAGEIAPGELFIQRNIARIATGLGLFELGAQALERIVQVEGCSAGDWFQLAESLDRLGHFEEAMEPYEAAIRLEPNNFLFHVHCGYALLRRGRFREGWRELGWYWRPEGLAQFSAWGLRTPKPLLQEGDSVQGKSILVTGWGGVGDLIMFSQMAEHLSLRGAAQVTLHFADNTAFFGRNRWGYPVASHTDVDDFFRLVDRHDAWVPNARIPGVLSLGGSDIASAGAYFFADPQLRTKWRSLLSSRPGRIKVGIAWSGNPGNMYERNRSIPTADLLPLLNTPDVDWYVVQKNERNAELAAYAIPTVHDPSAAFTNLEETAALMSELDLIISADSLPAHLAGSLGQPVWLLVSAAADWRWGLQGTTTGWYRSARLYRQEKLGDWQSVLARVAADLRAIEPGRT